jgi:hypothetical protein
MTKKRLALIAVLPLTFAVGLCVLAMLPPRPGVTKGNYDRIEKGMTKAEVEEIFGEEGIHRFQFDEGQDASQWWGDDFSRATVFFINDHVEEKSWRRASNESALDIIRRWLHIPKGA